MYHSRGGELYPDRAGNVWSIFDGQNSGTTNEIYLRMLPSSARDTKIQEWTQTLRISEDDKRPSIYPSIVAEDATRVAAVWMDYRHKSTSLCKDVGNGEQVRSADLESWIQRSRGEVSMTPNQILWTAPRYNRATRIARAGDGSVWAVWGRAATSPQSMVVRRLSGQVARNHNLDP
jgi:hypothetical protein